VQSSLALSHVDWIYQNSQLFSQNQTNYPRDILVEALVLECLTRAIEEGALEDLENSDVDH